jgi:hypothetical protein
MTRYDIDCVSKLAIVLLFCLPFTFCTILHLIRVITILPNSEQSYKGKVKTHNYIKDKISQQPENCENRNDPDLVQAFLKKWWVESGFKAPNLPLSLRLNDSGCHYNSIYNNTETK